MFRLCVERPCARRDLHSFPTRRSSDLALSQNNGQLAISWKTARGNRLMLTWEERGSLHPVPTKRGSGFGMQLIDKGIRDRKSTRLNSSHVEISYAVFCLKKKKRLVYNT